MMRISTLMTWVSLVLFTTINIHAATITSNQSGDWNNAATWNGGIPTIGDDVIISSGNTVSIGDATLTDTYIALCKTLNIDGTLICNKNRFFVGYNFNNGGNFPVSVNGTLSVNSTFDYYPTINGYLKFNAGSTFNMSSGAFVVNGNSGFTATSVASGQAILDVTSVGTLNATGGTIYVINPHFTAGQPCIAGEKTFGNSVSFGNGAIPATPTNYVISNTAMPTFRNLEMNFNASNGSKAELSKITVLGAFGCNKGLMVNAGGLDRMFVKGDMNIGNGGLVEGDIEFNGALQQNINALDQGINTISVLYFKGNLIANNAVRVKIKLNIEIPKPYSLQLVNGFFDVGNLKIIVLNNPVMVVGTPLSNQKFVSTYDLYGEIGKLQINGITTETLFPIGYELGSAFSSYTPLKITPSVQSDFSANANPNPLNTTGYQRLNVQWDISRNNSATADITFQWNLQDEFGAYGSGNNRNNCKIFHYNTGTSIWDAITTSGASNSGTIYTKTASNVSSFSPFTVLTTPSLPVSLTEFKGKAVGSKAILTWSTASESNNLGFDIEKSLDGKSFSKIDFVKGNGNSNTLLSYISSDENFTQTAFYRLKQIDFDGNFEYSRIVQLEKTKTGSIKIYPNPIFNNANLTVEIASESNEKVDIILVDISGRIIFQNKYESASNLISIPTDNLARGLYFVKVQNGLNVTIQKIVKE